MEAEWNWFEIEIEMTWVELFWFDFESTWTELDWTWTDLIWNWVELNHIELNWAKMVLILNRTDVKIELNYIELKSIRTELNSVLNWIDLKLTFELIWNWIELRWVEIEVVELNWFGLNGSDIDLKLNWIDLN